LSSSRMRLVTLALSKVRKSPGGDAGNEQRRISRDRPVGPDDAQCSRPLCPSDCSKVDGKLDCPIRPGG